jgi:hypothetical protein
LSVVRRVASAAYHEPTLAGLLLGVRRCYERMRIKGESWQANDA